MKKQTLFALMFIFVFGLVFGFSAPVQVAAESSTQANLADASREQLLQMILRLQTQIKSLSARPVNDGVGLGFGSNTGSNVPARIEFLRELKNGVEGEEVVKLQKLLATDKAIYPEGLMTGFFGLRTAEAIKRLQSKFQLEVTGELDAKTRELINKILLSQGATKEIPPGLLIAPGLRERVKVRLENKDGRFEYRIDVEDDKNKSDDDEDDGDDSSIGRAVESRFKIEAETKSNDRTKIKVELRNGYSRAKRVFMLNTVDQDLIIAEVATRLGISKEEVKSVIKFDGDGESDDDDDDDDDGDGDDEDDDNR